MTAPCLKLKRISGRIGAEIEGVDLASPLDEQTYAEIRRALVTYGVIALRNQKLTADQYVAFAERFGEIERQNGAFLPTADDSRKVAIVHKQPDMIRTIGGCWHTDQIERGRPAWGAMLLCRKAPEAGGDTCFASMAAAYDSLSAGFKESLDRLRAVHWDGALQQRFQTGRPPKWRTSHPLVPTHPESGRRFLYISPGYTLNIDGWTPEESEGLLRYLYSVAEDPAYGCRIRWEENMLVFWDTYQTWHYAINDYDYGERVMHRISVLGPHFE
jgi:taurine dioxygenase